MSYKSHHLSATKMLSLNQGNTYLPNSGKCNAKVEKPPDKTSANASNGGMLEPEGAGGPLKGEGRNFGQLVNPIRTTGVYSTHTFTTGTPKFFHHPASLQCIC